MFEASRLQKIDRLLLVICLVGLVLRLGFVLSLEEKIYWGIDGEDYHALATRLIEGRGYVDANGEPTAYRPVGYPVFLAFIYLWFGRSITAVRVCQSIITTLLIVVVYLMARRMFDRKVACFAAAVCAVYPYFVYISGVYYPTALCTFLLAYLVYRLLLTTEEPTAERFVGLGLLAGALILIRPSFIAILPFLVAWCCLRPFARRRAPIRMWLAAGLAIAVCVMPWAIRNQQQIGTFTLSTNGGRNFWLGNNAAATASTGNDVPLPKDLEARLTEAASEEGRDRIYFQAGFQFIREDPAKFVKLTLGKVVGFWRLYPSPSTGFKQSEQLSKLASVLTYTPILLFAIVGVAVSWKSHWRRNLSFLCLIFSFNLLHALFISIVRLRLPVDVYLVVFASYGVIRVVDVLRRAVTSKISHGMIMGSSPDFVSGACDNKLEAKWPVTSHTL